MRVATAHTYDTTIAQLTKRQAEMAAQQERIASGKCTRGGSNQGNGAGLSTENVAWMHHNQSLVITLPPLAGIVLQLK